MESATVTGSRRKRRGPGRPPLKGTPATKDVLFTEFSKIGGSAQAKTTTLPATPKTQEDAFLELKNASVSLAQTGPKKRRSFKLSPADVSSSKKQSTLQLKDSVMSLVHTGSKSKRSFSANASTSLQSSAAKKRRHASNLSSSASDNEQPPKSSSSSSKQTPNKNRSSPSSQVTSDDEQLISGSSSSKRTPAGKRGRPRSSMSSSRKTTTSESELSASATQTPRGKRGRPKSSLSSSSKRSRREERVSFHQMVSVQEFSPHGATARTTSLQAEVPSPPQSPPVASSASDLPATEPLSGSSPGKRRKMQPSPRLFSDTIEEVPDAEHYVSPDPVNSEHPVPSDPADLEPLEEEEEEEEEVGEEPRLATPRIENVAGYEDTDDGEESAVVSRSPVKRGRGRPRKKPLLDKNSTDRPPVSHSSRMNLPRSLLKNLFCLYSKRRLTRGAMDRVVKFSAEYLRQASEDLAAYSQEAGRRSIKVEDVKQLLRQQTRRDERKHTFESMVNSYLPLEYAEQLLPCVLMPTSKQ